MKPYIVSVRFMEDGQHGDSGTEYNYLTDIDDLEVGDVVMVASPYGRNYRGEGGIYSSELGGYMIATRVSNTKPKVAERMKATKWIVDRVNVAKAVKREEREEELRETMLELEIELERVEEQKTLRKLAKASPTALKLTKRIEKLRKKLYGE